MLFLITKQRYYYKKVTILKAIKKFTCARYYIIWDPGGDRSQLTSHSLQARDGPFEIIQKYDNGSYLLQDLSGKVHKTRVNGWRLKPYFSQGMEDQAGAEQVILDSKAPLGVSDQDPSLALHVPYISGMSIGLATRPCIDTVLCNPGTTSGHLAIGREDESTSRLQGEDCITEGLEQEA